MDDKKLLKLKEMMDFLKDINEGLTREEFVNSFKDVLKVVKDLKDINSSEWKLIHEAMKKIPDQMMSEMISSMSTVEKKMVKDCVSKCERVCAEMDKEHKVGMGKVNLEMRRIKADRETIIKDVLAKVPPQTEETPERTRDKLETLKEDERLDKSAVKGIEAIEEKVKQIELRPVRGTAGRALLQLYVDGAKKGAIQYLNIIAGTNVSLTYAEANGRNDVTISVASAAVSVLTATGTVNDSNTAFTFASLPSAIVINGAAYRQNKGWSWDSGTLTATLDSPVGTGGDIYGLS